MVGRAGATGHRQPPGLKAKALQWLAQREHSRQELREKLLRWRRRSALLAAGDRRQPSRAGADGLADREFDPLWDEGAAAHGVLADRDIDGLPPAGAASGEPSDREIDSLLDQLAGAGLLSDARFAESRVHARAARYGNRRIEGELRHHGVRASDETVEQLRASELERARQVLQKRFGLPARAERPPAAERLRWQRFLAGRGFSAEAIAGAVRTLTDDTGADD